MAQRPVFIASDVGPPYVEEIAVDFTWYAGMAVSRKQMSIESLHQAARDDHDIHPILEVSSRSSDSLGRSLSAFQLMVELDDGREVTVESAFQGSKVFSGGGPFVDLYDCDGSTARRDPRIRESGELIGFEFDGQPWPTEPVHGFYEWLYNLGIERSEVDDVELMRYAGFTDIEFNPKRSWNCQARAVARRQAMLRTGLMPTADRVAFLRSLETDIRADQQQLF